MPKCAFLTMKDLSNFECYDNHLLEPMNKNGWECYFIPWDKAKMDWNYFDLAIIRSTWDYQDKINEFLKVLTDIDLSNCILQNSLNLIKWNIDKTYLETLSQKDVKIVPSLFFDKFSYDKLKKSFSHFSTDKLIIKPCISANADDTFVLKKGRYLNNLPQLEHLFRNRKFIVQPFIQSIIDEGEYSLIFFKKKHSHTLLKKPKKNDFRVQEEHGGILQLITNPDEKMLKIAKSIIDKLPNKSLYSRIDLVRNKKNFLLMEIELIEPSLYFNLNPEAAHTFSSIIDKSFRNNNF